MDGKFNACARSMLICLMLYTVIISTSRTLLLSGEICPIACKCESTRFTCNNTVPTVVPDNVLEVVIENVRPQTLYPGVFCNVTWPFVTKLCLVFHKMHILKGYVFDCLGRIQRMRISGNVWHIPEQAFRSLVNVTDLDFSGSILYSTLLNDLLSDSLNLPRLTHLNLSNCFEITMPLGLDQQMIDFLSVRQIQLLDFSHNYILFNFRNASELCKTLKTLILHDTQITYKMLPENSCHSLQLVDLSGNTELATGLKNCFDRLEYFPLFDFYFATKIQLDRLITDAVGYHTRNCMVWFKYSIYKLHFSHNFIPNYEILFDFSWSGNYLEFIDLSHNNIKNINKEAFAYIPTLQKVDLSHNDLNLINDFDGTLSSLFHPNPNLSSVNLASNGLAYLPDGAFLSNLNVTEIILTSNNFQQLSLNFTHLLKLVVLDLRFNKIQYLDKQSMERVDGLQKTQYHAHHLQLLLEGNPFTCRCEAQEFLRWFMTSTVFNASYTCHIDGKTIPMTEEAVRVAQEDCGRPKRRLRIILSSTLTPVFGLAATIQLGMLLYKRYKRKLEERKLQDRLHLIQEDNTGFSFTVFLSYCSRDKDFVVKHVRQPLEEHLRKLTKNCKENVCEEDQQFTPGHSVFQETEKYIAESALFAAVITDNYCASYLCQLELSEAQQTGKPITLIFKDQLNEDSMGIVIKNMFTNCVRAKIVQEGDNYQIDPGWERLCKVMIRQMKIPENPQNP